VLSRPVFDNASYRFNVLLWSWLTAVIVIWGKNNDMPYSFCTQTVNDATQVQVVPNAQDQPTAIKTERVPFFQLGGHFHCF
jgi:hypothetical protein